MKKAIGILILCAASLCAEDKEIVFTGFGGAINQVVDGAGWKTTMTFINFSNIKMASAVLNFYDDSGAPMTLATNLGTFPAFTLTIPPKGTITLTTAGLKSTLSQGWGQLVSSDKIGGTTVFTFVALGQPTYEASEPLDTDKQTDYVLPFDHTNGYATGFAVENPFSFSPLTVLVVFRDQNGNQILTDSLTLAAFEHRAFTLTQRYPQTVNLFGTVEISTSGLWLNVLGLRFSPSGVFTSVAPLNCALCSINGIIN
jgi:hypothetical protein